MRKCITIDYRGPRNKSEKDFFGMTLPDCNMADVFINVNKNRRSHDLVNTFFHELAHVFFAFHNRNKKMTSAEEERLAQQIGRVCEGVLR